MNTLAMGRWACELPGDAAAPPVRQPDEDFEIVPDSSYRVADRQRGTYLRLEDRFTMTSGPFAGRSYRLYSPTEAQRLDGQGMPMPLRCIRTGSVRGSRAALNHQ